MSPNPRIIASGVAAAVLGSGVTAVLLLAPTPSSAATPTSTEVIDSGDDSTTATEPEVTDARGNALRELLQPLVDAGTLTAEEADAIVAQLLEAVERPIGPGIIALPGGPGFPGDHGFPGEHDGPLRGRFRIVEAEVIAEAIGIDVAELSDELRSGSTIADIAEAHGVDPQAVIDALVADYTERVTAWIEGEQPASAESTAPESTDAATETTAA
jgi:hypothetical protein